MRGEKTWIPYGNDQCIRIFSVFLFRSFAMAIWRPVDPKLSVNVRLGIVGTLYSRSSKSSVQHILTYLPSYCKNNICGEWVVYAETVTISVRIIRNFTVGDTRLNERSLCKVEVDEDEPCTIPQQIIEEARALMITHPDT